MNTDLRTEATMLYPVGASWSLVMSIRMVLLATCLLAAQAQAGASYEASKAELESLYQQLKDHWPSSDLHRKRLINSQRAWHAFRDAECEFVSTNEDHTNHIDTYEQCTLALTLERHRALQQYLHCVNSGSECAVAAP
ncbi:lysozyme inhibitor LprI family protein [Pseudomonas turukhanskensis]|uniref:lysozyme inhibitor LprI family protein n=1 Tax=Pseudomonas turukhanskensis TaxID=1806536 RepID=UPI0022F2F150|nr:lysozyme inhibitor LprI family protein [Pseudomonas turukhanskensis]